MAAKAGPAHDWPNSGPLPASWKRSDQAGRVFFVHRGRELERDVALIGFRQRPLAPSRPLLPRLHARTLLCSPPSCCLRAGRCRLGTEGLRSSCGQGTGQLAVVRSALLYIQSKQFGEVFATAQNLCRSRSFFPQPKRSEERRVGKECRSWLWAYL